MLNSKLLIVCTAAFLAATVLPVTSAVETPPTPETPSSVEVLGDLQGCTRADATGTATVIGGPGAGLGAGWINPCVIIPNNGKVVFQQADAIPHGAEADNTCFNLGRMSVAGGTPAASDPSSTSIEIEVVLEDGLAYTTENQVGFGACGELEIEGNSVILPYHCIIHGARMPGTIVVEL